MFFLTEVDTERLNIRGSRDPLGLVPVWGHYGRKVVGNLTTASNSVRGFTTLLLGLYFAERVAVQSADRHATRLAAFLKFEQLAGFVRRLRHNDGSMRGITEIDRRIDEGNRVRFSIGARQDLQILANQKTYGLWGLFTVPAVASGLVVAKDLVLSVDGRALVEDEYLPIFRRHNLGDGRVIESLLAKEQSEIKATGQHTSLVDALATILSPGIRTAERAVYHRHLVRGGEDEKANPWQQRFAYFVEELLPKGGQFGYTSLNKIIVATGKAAADKPLCEHLKHIRDLEAVLVVMANLFGFLQNRDGARTSEVVSDLKGSWGAGLRHLRPDAMAKMEHEIATIYDDPTCGKRFVEFTDLLRRGSYAPAIDLILDHNSYVMKSRHDAQPWIQNTAGKIDVRFRGETEIRLLLPSELSSEWNSTFYLNSLKNISDQLRTN